jgi:hypothetical protein
MAITPVSVQLKASLPAKSTGRLLDALTDIIRPFTERRGLRADQIRLQREEVALKIAEMARKQIETQKAPVRAIPVKGLVQFLEKASLEDPSDRRMTAMWANLLANAATTDANNLPRHVSILSEMNSAQARLLELTIMHRARKIVGSVEELQEDEMYYHPGNRIALLIQDKMDQTGAIHESVALEMIYEGLNVQGFAIISIDVEGGQSGNWHWPLKARELKNHIGKPEHELDFNIMASLGLVTRETIFREWEPFVVYAYYWRVTYLGWDLFSRCNPGRFEPSVKLVGVTPAIAPL